MALVTYPLNNIEYSAEDAELFHVTRTSGIYAKNSFDYDITGTDNNIIIGTGIGWIKNSEFSGKVIAQKEAISLDVGLPDPIYPRIDAIIIQFDNNRNETNIVVKKGTAASNPVAPSVVQNESIYELHLYHVRREAGSLYITPSNITDLRLNSSYCGLMADSVTNVDTTAIEKQVSDLIKSLQDEISSVKDGTAYLLRNGSTNMTGNLPMGGHKVTELGTPTEDGDAMPLGYANQNFAPGGYGLGTTTPTAITTSEELDATRKCGFYRYYISSSNICGISLSSAAMIVYSNTANSCVQEIRPHNTNYCLRRNYVSGTWGAWELVGGVQKLLWENASPTSAFAAQTIALDLSGYDAVYIEAVRSTNSNVISGNTTIPVGGLSGYLMGTTDQLAMIRREVKATKTGVVVSAHQSANSSTGTSNEIPYRIYGIKGVSK